MQYSGFQRCDKSHNHSMLSEINLIFVQLTPKSTTMNYSINKKICGSFEEAIKKVTEGLNREGFGIITEIDLKEKFREKLDVDFRAYTILGACNPKLAYEAIQKEANVGVMLPCNVLVQESLSGQVEIAAINPIASIGAVQNSELESLAAEVSKKLQKVIDRIN